MKALENMIDKKVIVRGDRSGVEYGTLAEVEGATVELHNARRLWYWEGAASLSQMAAEGTKRPDGCRFTMCVDSIVILDAIEILPCTDKAIKSIEGVGAWKE